MPNDDDNHSGLAVVIGFLVLFWLLRALLKGADQSK